MSESNPYAPAAKSDEPTTSVEETNNESLEVPKGTVHEVLHWVGDDKEKAQIALDAEKDGAERVTLIHALEEILDEK